MKPILTGYYDVEVHPADAAAEPLQPAQVFEGTGGNDTQIGTESADIFRGYAGADSLIGNGGNDEMYGGGGKDTMSGDAGNDTLYGGGGADYLSDQWSGNNELYAGAGDDFVAFAYYPLTGTSRIDGGEGKDTLYAYWADAGAPVVWTNDPNATVTVLGQTISGFETLRLTLGAGNDQVANLAKGDDGVYGGFGNDRLDGGAGNDSLNGAEGNDTLLGGDGGDELTDQGGTDVLDGGAGQDLLTIGGNTVTLVAGSGDDTVVLGFGGSGSLDGGKGHDVLRAVWDYKATPLNLSDDPALTQQAYGHTITGFERLLIQAGSGNDTLLGDKDDVFFGNDGDDSLRGGNVNGGTGNDTLTGSDLGATLQGWTGNDVFLGGSGADTLWADYGNDTVTGGAGADLFRLNFTAVSAVSDFVSGTDHIELQLTSGLREVVSGPGGFSADSQLVVVTANIAGAITAEKAAAAIGSASSNYASWNLCQFVVDNGTDTAIYLFSSSGEDAAVTAAELALVASLSGTAATQLSDFI